MENPSRIAARLTRESAHRHAVGPPRRPGTCATSRANTRHPPCPSPVQRL